MSHDNNGRFFLGLVLGAVAGAAAGILFAPRSGEETRKMIGDKTKEYAKTGKDAAEKSMQAAREKVEEVLEDVSKNLEK